MVCTWLGSTSALAQRTLEPPQLTITELSYQDSVVITYDLKTSEPELEFNVTPYYLDTTGNRQWITTHVWGDVGDTITTGAQKQIVWNYYRAFPDGYKGTMELGLAYELIPPPATLPLSKERYRRGTAVNIPLDATQPWYFHLIDESRISHQQGQLEGEYTQIKLSNNLPLHGTYRIRVEDAQGHIAYTPSFTVRRHFPLGAIIGVPVVATGVGLYFIFRKDRLPEPHTF